jgi:hypothetical protein
LGGATRPINSLARLGNNGWLPQEGVDDRKSM